MTDFNILNSIQLLYKWRIFLGSITVLAIGLSALFSSPYFISPKYKSQAIIYPVNLVLYSEETPTEQMLQILNSLDIRNQLFRDFRLAEHYQIDTTAPTFYTTLNYEFDGNIKFQKTEYESVEIEVLDTDPKMACQMVDSIISYYNDKVCSLHRLKN